MTDRTNPNLRYECEECGLLWPVESAAETCAQQDVIDAVNMRRIYRSNN